jgi:hypothetical protein
MGCGDPQGGERGPHELYLKFIAIRTDADKDDQVRYIDFSIDILYSYLKSPK